MSTSDRQRRRDLEYLASATGCAFRDACWDCQGFAIVVQDGPGLFSLDVFHQATCPAAAGVVPWRARSSR